MFTRKKIAVASLVLSGFALTGMGVTQANAGGTQGDCTRDAQSNVTCSYKSEATYVSEDGTHHLTQTQDCTTVSRDIVDRPQSGVGQQGTTKVGASVDCSNTAPAPENFVAPVTGR